MPKIKVDLTNAGQDVLPDGDYLLVVLESSKVRKAQSGSFTIGWSCKVIDGEFEGKNAYFETSLVEAALWKVKDIVTALGLSWDEDGFELEDAFGIEFQAHLYSEPFEGRDFQKAEKFKPLVKASTKKK